MRGRLMPPVVGNVPVPIFNDSPYIVHFETLGCKLNQIETESAARYFNDAGFEIDMEPVTAAGTVQNSVVLCVVNTCTVTGKAEQKARRLIRLLLKKYPHAAVLVTGCYAELDAADIAALDSRVCVLPGSRKDLLAEIPGFLKQFLVQPEVSGEAAAGFLSGRITSLTGAGSERSLEAVRYTSAFRLSTDTFFAHSRASIKIQDGCNNACTYCRIHLARGKSVSLDARAVLERVQQLELRNQHEIVLTGVNLSQYRGRMDGSVADIADLLSLLLRETSSVAFRLSSLYPERVDEKLCRVLNHPRVRPHFHLSVQSGSDKILRKMGRLYTSEQVITAARRLREIKNDPFLACDVIAGFPGEDDCDFDATIDLCREAGFAWVHAFPFSARPGTPAFSMEPKVAAGSAAERVRRLTEFAYTAKSNYILRWQGKCVSAVTEYNRQDRQREGNCEEPVTHGVTENFIHVEIPGRRPQGELITVRIGYPLIQQIRNGDECEARAECI